MIVQVDEVPEHRPPQEVNVEPVDGDSVKVMDVPLTTDVGQALPPQVTVPLPVPVVVISTV